MNDQSATPVKIKYKDVRWQNQTVRLVYILNAPAGPPVFTRPGGAGQVDPNQNANDAIADELTGLFAPDKVRLYVESQRFYFEPGLGLEHFQAQKFEDEKEGWTTLTLKTLFS